MPPKKVNRIPDVDYEVGDEVVVVEPGHGRRVQGYGVTTFTRDERLIVRSSSAEHVRVRRPGGYVYVIPKRLVAPVDGRPVRFLGEAPEGMISPDDPRLDWLWRDAARVADAAGHCPEYDALCEALGIPGRPRDFSVRIEVAEGVVLSGKVTARSMAEAERMLVAQVRTRPLQAIGAAA